MYFVYILTSLKDGTHYIGYTGRDVTTRLKEHNLGKSKYTKGHRPYELTKYICVETVQDAKSKEKYFKRLKNSQKVIDIIRFPRAKRGTSPAVAGKSC